MKIPAIITSFVNRNCSAAPQKKILSSSTDSFRTKILPAIKDFVFDSRADSSYERLSIELEEPVKKDKFECRCLFSGNKILSRTKKFDIDFYRSLSEYEKNILRELCSKNKNLKTAVEENLSVGLFLKSYLDKEYGENKYAFVSLGTSPATLARVLEFSGVETKYLPISHLRELLLSDILFLGNKKLEPYKQFLSQQGINNEKIKNSDKEFLFFDYTATGQSLNLFEALMKMRLKIKSSNIHYLSLNELLKKVLDYNEDFINKYFNHSEAEKYGGVPHLDIKCIENVESCKEFSDTMAKKYNFLIIDELESMGLLKKNPKNSNSL